MNKLHIRKRWLEKNQKKKLTIALNVLDTKNDKIYSPFFSNYNSKHEDKDTLFIIPNKKDWHYIAAKKSPALLTGITSKHNGGYYF